MMQIGRQDPCHRKGVDDLTAEHQLGGLGDRIPAQREIRLLVVRLRAVDLREAGGQIHPHRLVAEPRRGVEVDEHLPGGRRQSGLFDQFAAGGQVRRLTAEIQQSGGQFPQPPAERVAVLVDQRDVAASSMATTPTAP
ncbi:hypothetical protein MNVM_00060 [Mycobacterium novum]|uniref:Uncharacterized protein n=1 Tax=Mycobacterium novum TaxID=2492438 RepID=A0A7I7JG83_9MYCO|nr:hypothetical protein MNVM_00060 [Mycobacterium novum]